MCTVVWARVCTQACVFAPGVVVCVRVRLKWAVCVRARVCGCVCVRVCESVCLWPLAAPCCSLLVSGPVTASHRQLSTAAAARLAPTSRPLPGRRGVGCRRAAARALVIYETFVNTSSLTSER